jgi:hypothetical protein
VTAVTRYGWSASQDVERVWREADILAAELGWKHGFVSSWADTSTWFPVGRRETPSVYGGPWLSSVNLQMETPFDNFSTRYDGPP